MIPSAAERPDLVRECTVLHRWVLGDPPAAEVVERYVDAHRRLGPRVDGVDPAVELARRGAHAVGPADAWTRIFRPTSLLRRKATLLVAILECRPETAEAFEAPRTARSPVAIAVVAAARGVAFLGRLALGAALLAPRSWPAERPPTDRPSAEPPPAEPPS